MPRTAGPSASGAPGAHPLGRLFQRRRALFHPHRPARTLWRTRRVAVRDQRGRRGSGRARPRARRTLQPLRVPRLPAGADRALFHARRWPHRQIDDSIRRQVRFQPFNLLAPAYPPDLQRAGCHFLPQCLDLFRCANPPACAGAAAGTCSIRAARSSSASPRPWPTISASCALHERDGVFFFCNVRPSRRATRAARSAGRIGARPETPPTARPPDLTSAIRCTDSLDPAAPEPRPDALGPKRRPTARLIPNAMSRRWRWPRPSVSTRRWRGWCHAAQARPRTSRISRSWRICCSNGATSPARRRPRNGRWNSTPGVSTRSCCWRASLSQGRPASAIAHLRRAIYHRPNSWRAHFQLAEIYRSGANGTGADANTASCCINWRRDTARTGHGPRCPRRCRCMMCVCCAKPVWPGSTQRRLRPRHGARHQKIPGPLYRRGTRECGAARSRADRARGGRPTGCRDHQRPVPRRAHHQGLGADAQAQQHRRDRAPVGRGAGGAARGAADPDPGTRQSADARGGRHRGPGRAGGASERRPASGPRIRHSASSSPDRRGDAEPRPCARSEATRPSRPADADPGRAPDAALRIGGSGAADPAADSARARPRSAPRTACGCAWTSSTSSSS